MQSILFLFIVLFSGMSYSQSQSREEENNRKYARFIELADSCLSSENYEEALVYYENALMYNVRASYPMQKISEIDMILGRQKYLQAADSCFNNKAFTEAKEYYMKVLLITPHDDYSKKKILEIESILMTEEKLRR